ncbi:MAG: restriction endonuclease [Pirellulaceae bacterium]|nr:restriction endonuclease [Pirellulaceae bacterium]
MGIPDFQSMMLPLLETIADGKEYSNREVADLLASRFSLTADDLRQMLPSGAQSVFTNRLAWAKAHLKRAGLLISPSRGVMLITEKGCDVLNQKIEKVNIAYLKQYPGYGWNRIKQDDRIVNDTDSESENTPEELLESSYQTLRDELAADLLEKVKSCSPAFFERLVVRLLVAMGYGGSLADAGQAIGRSGDGGIDGIIKEDKLGLDVVCIQAKRWNSNSVGREVIQSFAGSMEAYRARKGVFITTAAFTKNAVDYVKQIERKIVLIDGEQLAELMIDHAIGVKTVQTYSLKAVDLDYFIEE